MGCSHIWLVPTRKGGERPQDVDLRTWSRACAGGNKLDGAASTARRSAEWVGRCVCSRRVAAERGEGDQRTGKPDSVTLPNEKRDGHSSSPVIARGVQRPYPRASGGRPNPPIWSCSGWGLPSIRHHWRTGELLPRLFNLTRGFGVKPEPAGRCVFCGTFPRSLEAAVNGHPVLWSPDFPPPRKAEATVWSAGPGLSFPLAGPGRNPSVLSHRQDTRVGRPVREPAGCRRECAGNSDRGSRARCAARRSKAAAECSCSRPGRWPTTPPPPPCRRGG